MAIYFYRVNEPFGEFSNFAKFEFEANGKQWPTSEHYFQAQKFAGTPYEERVRLAKSARDAANLGRERSFPLRTDWEEVKDEVMREALRHKFSAYPALVKLLLSTGEEQLIEKTSDDHYWGCGSSGEGKNMLGVLLMELRSELRG